MTDAIHTVIQHIIGDLTWVCQLHIGRVSPIGANPALDALLSVKPLPEDYVRLADDKGVEFIRDPKGINWFAVKPDESTGESIAVATVANGSVIDCAIKVCDIYGWRPASRAPQQYLSVTIWLGRALVAAGATVAGMDRGGCIWVRESNDDYARDPMLLRVATDMAINRPRAIERAA